MRHSPIKRTPLFWRIWAGFLCLSLALPARPAFGGPNPAHALRPLQDTEGSNRLRAGLEELSLGDMAEVVKSLEESAQDLQIEIPPNARIHLFVTGGTSRQSHPMVNEVLSTLVQRNRIRVPYVYLPYIVPGKDPQKFRTILRAVRQGIRFSNGAEVVTASAGAPFKTEGKDLSSERDPKFAVTPGAEMFVRRSNGQLWSTMIDAVATTDWFEENFGPLKGLRVVVLGLGGVGSVFVDELEYRGVAEVTAAEPDAQKVEQVSRPSRKKGFVLSVVEPDDPAGGIVSTVLHEKIAQADVVFNITGLGKPNPQDSLDSSKPFSPLVHTSDQPLQYKAGAVAVDLNYWLREQNFLAQAKQISPGIRVENGAGVAIYSIVSILEILFREAAGIALDRTELKVLVRAAAIQHGLLPAAGLEEKTAVRKARLRSGVSHYEGMMKRVQKIVMGRNPLSQFMRPREKARLWSWWGLYRSWQGAERADIERPERSFDPNPVQELLDQLKRRNREYRQGRISWENLPFLAAVLVQLGRFPNRRVPIYTALIEEDSLREFASDPALWDSHQREIPPPVRQKLKQVFRQRFKSRLKTEEYLQAQLFVLANADDPNGENPGRPRSNRTVIRVPVRPSAGLRENSTRRKIAERQLDRAINDIQAAIRNLPPAPPGRSIVRKAAPDSTNGSAAPSPETMTQAFHQESLDLIDAWISKASLGKNQPIGNGSRVWFQDTLSGDPLQNDQGATLGQLRDRVAQKESRGVTGAWTPRNNKEKPARIWLRDLKVTERWQSPAEINRSIEKFRNIRDSELFFAAVVEKPSSGGAVSVFHTMPRDGLLTQWREKSKEVADKMWTVWRWNSVLNGEGGLPKVVGYRKNPQDPASVSGESQPTLAELENQIRTQRIGLSIERFNPDSGSVRMRVIYLDTATMNWPYRVGLIRYLENFGPFVDYLNRLADQQATGLEETVSREEVLETAERLYRVPEIFRRHFASKAGVVLPDEWESFVSDVREIDPDSADRFARLPIKEIQRPHGNLLRHKPTGKGFLIVAKDSGFGKSLYSAVLVGSAERNWEEPSPDSQWEYRVDDNPVVFRMGGWIIAGLSAHSKPERLTTRYPLKRKGFSAGTTREQQRTRIREKKGFLVLAGIVSLDVGQSGDLGRVEDYWKPGTYNDSSRLDPVFGKITWRDSVPHWSRVFAGRVKQLPLFGVHVKGDRTPQAFQPTVAPLNRWASRAVASADIASGLEEDAEVQKLVQRVSVIVPAGVQPEIGEPGKHRLGQFLLSEEGRRLRTFISWARVLQEKERQRLAAPEEERAPPRKVDTRDTKKILARLEERAARAFSEQGPRSAEDLPLLSRHLIHLSGTSSNASVSYPGVQEKELDDFARLYLDRENRKISPEIRRLLYGRMKQRASRAGRWPWVREMALWYFQDRFPGGAVQALGGDSSELPDEVVDQAFDDIEAAIWNLRDYQKILKTPQPPVDLSATVGVRGWVGSPLARPKFFVPSRRGLSAAAGGKDRGQIANEWTEASSALVRALIQTAPAGENSLVGQGTRIQFKLRGKWTTQKIPMRKLREWVENSGGNWNGFLVEGMDREKGKEAIRLVKTSADPSGSRADDPARIALLPEISKNLISLAADKEFLARLWEPLESAGLEEDADDLAGVPFGVSLPSSDWVPLLAGYIAKTATEKQSPLTVRLHGPEGKVEVEFDPGNLEVREPDAIPDSWKWELAGALREIGMDLEADWQEWTAALDELGLQLDFHFAPSEADTAGLEEEGEELELVSFLAELRQIMEEGNWPTISQLGPLSLANRFFREDPPLSQTTVEALNETVQEISRHLQGNPPEDYRVRALLRKLQAVMVRYLMATWNLSEQAASDFAVDNGAHQGNVWSMQILQWGDSFQEEKQAAGSERLDFGSSDAMQHIGAYLMLELTTPPQQFDDPRAADQSLNVYGPGFYLSLRSRARQMRLQEPRFGPEQMAAGIKRSLAQWAGQSIPLQLKIDILRERHPALRNAALIFDAAFERTITELGYPSMGMELSRQIQKGFESLRKDYPDYPIWRPGDPAARLEEAGATPLFGGEAIAGDKLAARLANVLPTASAEDYFSIRLHGPLGDVAEVVFSRPAPVDPTDREALQAVLQDIARFAQSIRAALQEIGVNPDNYLQDWRAERLGQGEPVEIRFTREGAGLEERRGFVLVGGVGLVAPRNLPEESYFVVAVGPEQAAALIQAGRAPGRIIAVATISEEVSALAALGIPGDQIVRASDWPTLEAAKNYAVRLGRDWLAGLQGLRVSVLQVTARSPQGVLAQLLEMLPSGWQLKRPVTAEDARQALELSV